MIPLRDANPSLTTPIITVIVIVAASVVFFAVQPREPGADLEFTYENAAIACELTTGEALSIEEINTGACIEGDGAGFFSDKSLIISVLVSMFLHGGLLHLVANMWSLWIFGNNVEDAFGRGAYVVLYLTTGVAATLGFVALNPETTIPLVGASGAIAGVMGAYLVLFPRARVVSVFPVIFFIPIGLPAIVFLAIWFASQFAISGPATGIAWEAHVVGFIAGAFIAAVFRRRLLARVQSHRLRLGHPGNT